MRLNSLGIHLYRIFKQHLFLLVYLPLFVYWIALFVATTLPGDKLPMIGISDKIEHFVSYFILAFYLNFTLHFQHKFKKLAESSSLYTILIVAIYGMVDELHQLFIPGRFCDILDWTADILGGLAGLMIVYIIIRSIKNNFPGFKTEIIGTK